MGRPTVAIAIPTKNRHGPLAKTLSRCGLLKTKVSIFICDQSQTAYPSKPGYRVDHRPDITSLPAARNALLRTTTSDYVLFMDDDTDLGIDFIDVLQQNIDDHPQVAAWGPVIETRPLSTRRLHRIAHHGVFTDPRRQTSRRSDRPTTALFGCCFAVKRSAALAVNGFDESRRGYALGEDYDFCLKLQHNNYPLRFAKDLRAIHRRDGEDRADPGQRGLAKGQWLRYLARRHGGQNPATICHLALAAAAAASGMGSEPGTAAGVMRGLGLPAQR